MTNGRIDFEASAEIHNALSSISRTEDIKLSPDNSRLAIVDFICNRIFLFSTRFHGLDNAGAVPRIELLDYSVITSDSFRQPHGVVFLDNDTLVVCNREADVCLYRIPAPGELPREREINPRKSIRGKGFLLAKVKTPGSVESYALGDNRYRILVCNNHWHFISSHVIELGNDVRIKNEGTLIQNALKIPDGISVSPDKAWIAISNHVDGEILVYANTPELDHDTQPAAALKGIVCPHGVRFAPDGKVLVADAASQYLHVYESDNGNWHGEQYPARSIEVMDEKMFYDGRYDAREGGLKGLDVENSGRILVTTHRLGVLEFYDLDDLLSRESAVDCTQMIALCHERDQSLERQRGQVLSREWTFAARAVQSLRELRRNLRQYKQRTRVALLMQYLYLRNRWSRQSVLDPSGPAVSMTTHVDRLELVFYALESIARGTRKPGRMILWLTDKGTCSSPPETLERLKARGLEIRYAEELGPHTKYYPYIVAASELTAPLVTADDDTLYPGDWIERLIEAHAANAAAIHCHRARRIRVGDGRLMPYNDWQPCEGRQPSHLNFITGVSGVLYPPAYLQYLKEQGKVFMQCCPYGDDIWLSVNALRGGFKVAQIDDRERMFPKIPGSQKRCLYDINVLSGLNQVQLRQTYSESDLLALLESA